MVSLCITNAARDAVDVLSGLLLTQDGWVLTAAHDLDLGTGGGWVASASDAEARHIFLDSNCPVLKRVEDDFALLKFARSGPIEPMPFIVRRDVLVEGEKVTALRPRFHLKSAPSVDRSSGNIVPDEVAVLVRVSLDEGLSRYGTARHQIIALTQGIDREYSGGPVVDDSGALVGIASKCLEVGGWRFSASTSILRVASILSSR